MSVNQIDITIIIAISHTCDPAVTLQSIADQMQSVEVLLAGDSGNEEKVLLAADPFRPNIPEIRFIPIFPFSVGKARNKAVAEAAGKYIVFLKPGDVLKPGALGKCTELAEEENPDFITFDIGKTDNDTEDSLQDLFAYKRIMIDTGMILKDSNYQKEYYHLNGILFHSAAYYFSRDYLIREHLAFLEADAFIDDLFILKAHLSAEKMHYYPHILMITDNAADSSRIGLQDLFHANEMVIDGLSELFCLKTEEIAFRMMRHIFSRCLTRMELLIKDEEHSLDEELISSVFGHMKDRISGSNNEILCYYYFLTCERFVYAVNEEQLQKQWENDIGRLIRARTEVLRDKGNIGLYGTGAVALSLLRIMNQYADELTEKIFFVHSDQQTGFLIYGHKLYNISDIDEEKLDAVIIASVNYQDEMEHLLEKQQFHNPVYKLPRIAKCFQLNDHIRKPLMSPNTDRAVAEKPFLNHEIYIAGLSYHSQMILSSFPGLRKKITAIIDDHFKRQFFCDIPVINTAKFMECDHIDCTVVFSMTDPICKYESMLQRTSARLNVKKEQLINLSQLLCSYLELWRPVEYRPQRLNIEASTLCQLDCAGCYMRLNHYGTVGKGFLTFEDYKNLTDNNPEVRMVELSNSGEVFLNPDLYDILNYSYEHHIMIQMYNGVNLNHISEEVLEAIVRYQVDCIVVSIDGATQETYEKYRRNGNLAKVLQNIRIINQYKEKYNSNKPALYWQYILMEHNQDEIPAAKKLAAELDMKMIFKLDWRGGFMPKDPDKIYEYTGIRSMDSHTYLKETGHAYYSEYMCKQLILSPQINWDGRLLGCCNVFLSDWGVNVLDHPLSDIFNIEEYRTAVISLLSGCDQGSLAGPCGTCKMYTDNVISYGSRLLL